MSNQVVLSIEGSEALLIRAFEDARADMLCFDVPKQGGCSGESTGVFATLPSTLIGARAGTGPRSEWR